MAELGTQLREQKVFEQELSGYSASSYQCSVSAGL